LTRFVTGSYLMEGNLVTDSIRVHRSALCLTAWLAAVSLVFMYRIPLPAQETLPVGKSKGDQERNAELLSGYDYKKYPEALTVKRWNHLQAVR